MNRIVNSLMSIVVMMTLVSSAFVVDIGATNTPSDWAQERVEKAISWGIVPEELQGDYQAEITRAEFAKVAVHFLLYYYNDEKFRNWEYEGKPDIDGEVTFDNVVEICTLVASPAFFSGKPYEENVFSDTNDSYVNLAYALGIVRGLDDGTFHPDGLITRQEAAVMLTNTDCACSPSGFKVQEKGSYFSQVFSDHESVDYWAWESVRYMYQWDIMTGVGNGLWDPLGHYTREQCFITFCKMVGG